MEPYRMYHPAKSLAEAPRASRWRRFRGWLRGTPKKWDARNARRLEKKWDEISKKAKEVDKELQELSQIVSVADIFFHMAYPYEDDL